jgi:hypothetical protein
MHSSTAVVNFLAVICWAPPGPVTLDDARHHADALVQQALALQATFLVLRAQAWAQQQAAEHLQLRACAAGGCA